MQHYTSLFASLASLVLMAAVYYCNYLSPRDSWLRGQTLQMILLAALTGLFFIAVPAAAVGVFGVLTEGLSLATLLNSGIEIASIVMIVATVALFRRAVRKTVETQPTPHNVTPLSPRPATPTAGRGSVKKAA